MGGTPVSVLELTDASAGAPNINEGAPAPNTNGFAFGFNTVLPPPSVAAGGGREGNAISGRAPLADDSLE